MISFFRPIINRVKGLIFLAHTRYPLPLQSRESPTQSHHHHAERKKSNRKNRFRQ